MVSCSVPGCASRSDNQNWKKRVNEGRSNVKITFHSIPKNETTRSLWFDILGINSPSIPSGARICSKHFEEKFLDRTSRSLVRLRPNALPCKELQIEPATKTNVTNEALHELQYSHTVEASSSVTVTTTFEPPTWEMYNGPILTLEDCYRGLL